MENVIILEIKAEAAILPTHEYARCVEGERQGCKDMAKQQTMTLHAIPARKPNIDLAKIDATTEEDIRRHMREECNAPDNPPPEL